MASKTTKTAQETLMADFQALVSDTERLLEHTATLAGDQADQLRTQIHDSLLLFAGLALVFALLLLIGLSALVLILFWDTYRLPAIIGLCVFYTLAALFCALRLKAAIFDESSPFHATLEELANDRERLLP